MASMQPSATAAWRRWRFRGIVLLLVLPVLAAYALAMAGNARADGSGPSPDPSAGALEAAPGQAEQASTDQAANAAAEAAQEARNVVVLVRVDSPGDDGAVSQENTSSSQAGATNDASTAQGRGAGGDDGGSSLEAATQQAANAVAAAAQQAQNIVISIRINSPGDNGSIGQSNSSSATGNAGNTAATNQGMPAGSAQAGSGDDVGSDDAGSAAAPGAAPQAPAAPATGSAQPVAPAAAGSRTVLARLIATRPSHSPPAGAPAIRPAAHRGGGPSATPRPDEHSRRSGKVSGSERGSAGAPQDFASAPSTAAPPTTRTVWSPAKAARASSHSAPAGAQAPKQNGGFGGMRERAASWLSNVGHAATGQQDEAQNVTDPVILALIAVLVVIPLLLLSTFGPDRLRALSPRTRIHR
jgi:hypothetical protein